MENHNILSFYIYDIGCIRTNEAKIICLTNIVLGMCVAYCSITPVEYYIFCKYTKLRTHTNEISLKTRS